MGKRDMGSERRRNMAEGDGGRVRDEEGKKWTWKGKVERGLKADEESPCWCSPPSTVDRPLRK